ncbi:hypothetical protein RGP44_005281 [Serratia marcescens]|uniref:Protease n=7 Tax=Enterobacterales TaxID=91347 RepID=M4THS3_SERMA|nr:MULTISPECIES: hypothetical protein [Serratia]AGH62554.1 hypothetical protein [Serratia marcescens]AGZ03776.1 hypothetical protein SME112820_15 [Serratia marcescens]AGZ03815.1 hypothetical protein SME10408_15 [Serratia marcescens]AGZ03850.1 hypothetical protein SME12620_15 [Serratia marcescens]AXH01577.1 hypothetical protein [Serratia marcescens]
MLKKIIFESKCVYLKTSLFFLLTMWVQLVNSASSDYVSEYNGTYLKFLASEGDNDLPRLKMTIFNKQLPSIVVDTGSTGIVISANAIPSLNDLPSKPGKIIYNSSGRIMLGVWVETPVIISGDNGVSISTKSLPILAVSEIACLENARDCTPQKKPRDVYMMGVGFARENSMQKQSTPDTNPFLNTRENNYHKGYIMTRHGVYLGITDKDVSRNFSIVNLIPSKDIVGEWKAPSACIKVSTNISEFCGSALVDTGVKDMFLTLPGYFSDSGEQLSPGDEITIKLSSEIQYTVVYDGEKNATSPARIFLNTKRATPFVNTGVNFLNDFDILYDADAGLFGYRYIK